MNSESGRIFWTRCRHCGKRQKKMCEKGKSVFCAGCGRLFKAHDEKDMLGGIMGFRA